MGCSPTVESQTQHLCYLNCDLTNISDVDMFSEREVNDLNVNIFRQNGGSQMS